MQKSLVIFSLLACSGIARRVQAPGNGKHVAPPESFAEVNVESVPLKSLATMLAASTDPYAFQAPGSARSFAMAPRGSPAQMQEKKFGSQLTALGGLSAVRTQADLQDLATKAQSKKLNAKSLKELESALGVEKIAAIDRLLETPLKDLDSQQLTALQDQLEKRFPELESEVGKASAEAWAEVAKSADGAEADVRDLEDLAKKLNPAIGYFDPLELGRGNFWGQGNEATKGFLRHSEIKHGRVAMAAFIGYIAQSNGITHPFKFGDVSPKDILAAGSPPEQWDAVPTYAKVQILLFIGFLEFWSEYKPALEADGNAHYMKGGKPGAYPSFKPVPHIVPPFELYDPFRQNTKLTDAQKERKLLAEINNGRAAMLGIMAFLAEQKVPGAVPALKSIAPGLTQYSGEIMAPFAAVDKGLPFVSKMLNIPFAKLFASGM